MKRLKLFSGCVVIFITLPFSEIVSQTISIYDKMDSAILCIGDFDADIYPDTLKTSISSEEKSEAIINFGHTQPTQKYVIEGYTGYFGISCANVGDVNKDSYEDFTIGAYTAGKERQGIVYIFTGGPDLDNKPDIQLVGLQSESSFGYSVAGIGDINNDGYSDMIVGAPTGGNKGNGQAFIYLGGSPMSTQPAVTLDGEKTDDFFGGVIASCQSRDWPKRSDFIISAYENDDSGVSSGKVYAYEGKWPLQTKPKNSWKGEAPGDCFGYALAAQYNKNGDEKWEWVIDAPFNDEVSENGGKTYIYPNNVSTSVISNTSGNIPTSFKLEKNYPNPFNNNTIIKFGIPQSKKINVVVYDILGKRVKVLVNNQFYKEGFHEIMWNGLDEEQKSVTSGIYLIKLNYDNEIKTMKMTYLK